MAVYTDLPEKFISSHQPGALFYTEVTIQRWIVDDGLGRDKAGNKRRVIANSAHRIDGLLNGPFHFILVETENIDFVKVLTPWGVCFIDHYDFRDHCTPVCNRDGA